jgi:phage shock protein A
MFRFMRRVWRYMTASMRGRFEEFADPKVQLEQAIEESQKQHKMLTEQAANVIAHQKQTEMQLDRSLKEVEKVGASARQALVMADQAQKQGRAEEAAKYTQAAEAFANRLIATESEVEMLKQMHLQSTEAANSAKKAVQSNSLALQQKLTEKERLLSQLDQAKMQERMSTAMQSLNATVGEDVPTLDEVRRKIETRYARALGRAEIQQQGVQSKMIEVEQAAMNAEAHTRLDSLRAELGLAPATAEAVGAGATPTADDILSQAASGSPAPAATNAEGDTTEK